MRKPTIIDFNITNHCNAKCPTCKRFSPYDYLELDHNLKVFHMDYDRFKKIIEDNEIYFRKTTCYFCGEFGDPMMHPKIKDFAQTANTHFKNVEIYTNGALNRKEFIDYVINTKNNIVLRFGIDGLTHEINNKYRINAKTEIAFKNMLAVAKVNKAKWDYTLFEHNFHELENVIKYAIDNNIKLMIRCNLRPSVFGINRIQKQDYGKFLELAEKYKQYELEDQIEFDRFWIDYNES